MNRGGWKFKFPDGPPAGFDPENQFEDKVALVEAREHVYRQKFVKMERAKIIREKLKECYWREGVNNRQACKELAERYLTEIEGTSLHVFNIRD